MISVVIPVRDEEQSVEALYEELVPALDGTRRPWEVVFVDDGSTDATFAALTRIHHGATSVKVVRLRRNFGKAAALDAGFREASGDVIVTMDGDGQDDPAEIPKLLAKLDEGFDLVSGWKTRRRDPLRRRVVSRLFNAVTGRVSGLRLHDMNCGLKAFRVDVARSVRVYGELHRYIPVLAHYQGFRVVELPVNHRPRTHGRSRYGLERYVRGFLDLLTVTFMGRYRYRPLHLFGGLGLALTLIGSAVLVYLFAIKVAGHAIGHRPLLTLGVLLVVVGMQFLSLGLLSEMLTSQHEERRLGLDRSASHADEILLVGRRAVRALAFGTYDRAYPRNAQVVSALRTAGVEVVEQNRPVWGGRSNWSLGVTQVARVAAAEAALLAAGHRDADVLLVGYPGHFDLPAARRAARGRPVVFNPLVSLHDTLVGDRGRFGPRSPAARVLAAIDRHAFRAADLVVADTEAHATFFREAFGLPHDRVAVCLVGAEDALFHPGRVEEQPFHALFVGKLIPLHGIDVVLEAARLLPGVPFHVVGSGQLDRALEERPANVRWTRWVEAGRLPGLYRSAGCALGVFAKTPKAARVIPNKAFQAIACACPLVTADTPGARELLRDGADALLVPPGDPRALADAIARLAADAALRARIAAGGRETYAAHASEPVLGARWRGLLEALVAGR